MLVVHHYVLQIPLLENGDPFWKLIAPELDQATLDRLSVEFTTIYRIEEPNLMLSRSKKPKPPSRIGACVRLHTHSSTSIDTGAIQPPPPLPQLLAPSTTSDNSTNQSIKRIKTEPTMKLDISK